MKKINILKNNRDFKRIVKNQNPLKYKEYMIFLEKTEEQVPYHFGLSVSKKLGNAVTRNRLKRQIRSIIDKKDYKKGFNCIIILRKSILEKTYQEMEENLMNAFKKINIIKGETNEKTN